MTMKSSPYVSPFLLLVFLLVYNISSSLSLSTISISETSYTSFICALVPSNIDERQSLLNCTSFPRGHQIPFTYPNISALALTAGNNYQCIVRSPTTNTTSVNCWRFSSNVTYKRIYRGLMLDELDAGNSHICGRVSRTNRLECWQWPEFNSNIGENISGIAVGGEFVCGLNRLSNIECFGNDASMNTGKPSGNFSNIAAGSRHACAISVNGSIECWGDTMGTSPVGVFKSLALGDRRSCALHTDSTVVCWGESNFILPRNLVEVEFLRIEALGSTFCGVVKQNFSLYCWGGANGGSSTMLFNRVLPGPCAAVADCPCGIMLGSGMNCFEGAICQPCEGPITNAAPRPNTSPSPIPPEFPRAPPRKNGRAGNARIALLVVGCVGTFSLAMMLCFFVFKFCKTRVCRIHDSGRLDEVSTRQSRQLSVPVRSSIDKTLSTAMSFGGHMEEFNLQVLLRVTENFSQDHKIGYGSFGSVYRAKLDDGREVAIKRAELTVSTSYLAGAKRQDRENAFVSELALLSRVNHKNLVRLFGFCEDGHERILVYEFMPNGTLHDHLHKFETSPLMSWTTRLRVALDAARGIEYLHTYAVPPVIHRDIKSSNILLDATWIAKVSDFGLSLMGPENDEAHLSLHAAGTIGYVDPEYYRLQQLTTKSDVYSFGVVLLELLSGFKAIHQEDGQPRNIVDFALQYIVKDEIHHMLDRKLPPPTPFEIEAVVEIGYMAADCVTLQGRDRPSMTEIVNSLERALSNSAVLSVISESMTETL